MDDPKDESAAADDTAALFARAGGGDEQAIAALLVRHRQWIEERVHRGMSPVVRREADTEDVVQQVMIRVLRAGNPVRVATAAQFHAFMAVVVDNALRSVAGRYTTQRRDARRERALDTGVLLGRRGEKPVDEISEPVERAARRELEAVLHCAMDLLPPLDQDVLWLLYRDELPVVRVAQIVGLKESGVRMRRDRALRKLKRKVGLLLADRLDEALQP